MKVEKFSTRTFSSLSENRVIKTGATTFNNSLSFSGLVKIIAARVFEAALLTFQLISSSSLYSPSSSLFLKKKIFFLLTNNKYSVK